MLFAKRSLTSWSRRNGTARQGWWPMSQTPLERARAVADEVMAFAVQRGKEMRAALGEPAERDPRAPDIDRLLHRNFVAVWLRDQLLRQAGASDRDLTVVPVGDGAWVLAGKNGRIGTFGSLGAAKAAASFGVPVRTSLLWADEGGRLAGQSALGPKSSIGPRASSGLS